MPRVHEIIDVTRFSNRNKLFCTIVWGLRFVEDLRRARTESSIVKGNQVSASEVDNTKQILIKSIQKTLLQTRLLICHLNRIVKPHCMFLS